MLLCKHLKLSITYFSVKALLLKLKLDLKMKFKIYIHNILFMVRKRDIITNHSHIL